MNHIWKISNPRHALSVSWFTLRTIFRGSVIYTVHCPCHGSPNEPHCNLHCDSSVILLNLYGISINTRFYPFLLYMVHPTKSLASVGLAQAHPNKQLINVDVIELKPSNVHKGRSIVTASSFAFSAVASHFPQLLKCDTDMVASYRVVPYLQHCYASLVTSNALHNY